MLGRQRHAVLARLRGLQRGSAAVTAAKQAPIQRLFSASQAAHVWRKQGGHTALSASQAVVQLVLKGVQGQTPQSSSLVSQLDCGWEQGGTTRHVHQEGAH